MVWRLGLLFKRDFIHTPLRESPCGGALMVWRWGLLFKSHFIQTPLREPPAGGH